MAGFERFNKRWAANGQTETITDNNAALGLVFLGDEPPSAELHNQMFQWLDEKDNYLFAQLTNAVEERTGQALTESNLNALRDAIATAATTSKAGIQRNATGAETAAMSSAVRTVTPASLKPLIDSLVLGIANSVPSGGVLAFARSSAPAGWLVADGATYSRSQYIDLFNAIGTTFGAPSSSTFNVPNIQGAVVRGWNGGSGVDSGRAFGSMQNAQNQAHTHGVTVSTVADHTHSFTTSANGGHTHSNTVAADGGHTHSGGTAAAGWHAHSASSDAAGSHAHSGGTNTDGAHNHVAYKRVLGGAGLATYGDYAPWGDVFQPTIATYAGTEGSAHSHGFTTNTVGNHAHTVSIAGEGTHSHTVTINAVGNHTHTVTINGVGDHAHSGTTAANGGHTHSVTLASEGGENRMYNIALLYCIKI